MFDREGIELALRAWRAGIESQADTAQAARPPLSSRSRSQSGETILNHAIGTTFDQLAADLALVERCELMLADAAMRLGHTPALRVGANVLQPMAKGGIDDVRGFRRHVVPDSVLESLRRERTDLDRREDDEIASETSGGLAVFN